MGLFDAKEIGNKLGKAKEKMGEAVANAKLDEKFEKAKIEINKTTSEMKEKSNEMKKLKEEAKASIEGAIERYQVIYLGGFPNKPKKKSNSLALGFNIMEDCFIFKPEYLAKTEWFGEENFVIPYEKVVKFEVVKRQVSTTEHMLSNGDTKSLEQLNNIEISYIDDNGSEQMTRVEMLTGFTIYKQAEKCRELLDLLREHNILSKLNKQKSEVSKSRGEDILQQIEKLSELKEKGILSEEEFNSKKVSLLEKM